HRFPAQSHSEVGEASLPGRLDLVQRLVSATDPAALFVVTVADGDVMADGQPADESQAVGVAPSRGCVLPDARDRRRPLAEAVGERRPSVAESHNAPLGTRTAGLLPAGV